VPTTFDTERFDCCGRSNVEHALHVLEIAAMNELRGTLRRIEHENAAATLRELLNPEGVYYGV